MTLFTCDWNVQCQNGIAQQVVNGVYEKLVFVQEVKSDEERDIGVNEVNSFANDLIWANGDSNRNIAKGVLYILSETKTLSTRFGAILQSHKFAVCLGLLFPNNCGLSTSIEAGAVPKFFG